MCVRVTPRSSGIPPSVGSSNLGLHRRPGNLRKKQNGLPSSKRAHDWDGRGLLDARTWQVGVGPDDGPVIGRAVPRSWTFALRERARSRWCAPIRAPPPSSTSALRRQELEER